MSPRLLKILGGVLAALLVVLIPVLRDRRGGAERLWTASPADAVKLTIDSGGVRAALEKRDGRWRLVEPLDYPADSAAVDELVTKTAEAKLSPILSNRPEKHALFEVDDAKGVRLTLQGSDPTAALDVRVGKAATRYDAVYVRREGEDAVREAAGLPRHLLEKTPKEWLDRTVASIRSDDIERLSVRSSSGTMVFERSERGWKVRTPALGASSETVKEALTPVFTALIRLEADEVILPKDFPADPGFQSAAYVVQVKTAAGETVLTAGKKDAEGRFYVRKDQETRVLYAMYPWRLKPFQRAPADFR